MKIGNLDGRKKQMKKTSPCKTVTIRNKPYTGIVFGSYLAGRRPDLYFKQLTTKQAAKITHVDVAAYAVIHISRGVVVRRAATFYEAIKWARKLHIEETGLS